MRVQWSRRADGLVAELAYAERSGDILVSLIPDPELKAPGRLRRPALELWDLQGNRLWRQDLKVQSRLVALSDDGAWVAAQSHLEELVLLNRAGRKQWACKVSCRPIFVPRQDFLICHHDDAAEPAVSFEFLSLKDGKVLASYSHPVAAGQKASKGKDPLAVRLSPDRSQFAVAYSGGTVQVFSLTQWNQARAVPLKPVRELELSGEITDFSFAEGALWILHDPLRGGGMLSPARAAPQTLSRWSLSASGDEALRAVSLPKVFRQLEAFDRGVWLYSNASAQQSLLRVEWEPALGVSKLTWMRTLAGASEYSSHVRDFSGDALLGLEWPGSQGASTLALVSQAGELRWSLPVTDPAAGGLLYTHATGGAGSRRLVAASDTGRLWMVEEESPQTESPSSKGNPPEGGSR